MKTIETTQTAGPDKLLHVTIPVDEANRPYRMVIVLTPEHASAVGRRDGLAAWPPVYFETVCGSVQDETFFRHPQCDRCLDKPQPE
jgi:hypothetical protein